MRQLRTLATATVLIGTLLATGAIPATAAAPSTAGSIVAGVPADWQDDCDSIRSAGHAFVRGVNCRSIFVDGFERHYIVYVPRDPDFDINVPAPLVFMFHGTGGTAPQFLRISRWRELSESEGLISIFPQGLRYRILDSGRKKSKWNKFGLRDDVDLDEKPAGYPDAAPWPANDVRFVTQILGDVESRLTIDAHRRFVAGFSNGAEFAARLAIQRSHTFAAAAYFAGGLDGIHRPDRHMPVLNGAGTLDDRILAQVDAQDPPPDPALTELPLDPDEFLAIPPIAAFLTDQLASFGLKREPHADFSQPHRTLFTWTTPKTANVDGNEFDYLLFEGVTHQYPNETNNPEGFRFARLSWDFFVAHPLP